MGFSGFKMVLKDPPGASLRVFKGLLKANIGAKIGSQLLVSEDDQLLTPFQTPLNPIKALLKVVLELLLDVLEMLPELLDMSWRSWSCPGPSRGAL